MSAIPRPKDNDPEVLAVFYKIFAIKMQKNCRELCAGLSLQEIEDALSEAGKPCYDGYEYAKKLEYDGWDGITADDVEMLDSANTYLSDVHDSAVRQWVQAHDINPTLEDGASCIYKGEAGRIHYKDREMQRGKYLFRSAQWIEEHGDSGGKIINWEDAH